MLRTTATPRRWTRLGSALLAACVALPLVGAPAALAAEPPAETPVEVSEGTVSIVVEYDQAADAVSGIYWGDEAGNRLENQDLVVRLGDDAYFPDPVDWLGSGSHYRSAPVSNSGNAYFPAVGKPTAPKVAIPWVYTTVNFAEVSYPALSAAMSVTAPENGDAVFFHVAPNGKTIDESPGGAFGTTPPGLLEPEWLFYIAQGTPFVRSRAVSAFTAPGMYCVQFTIGGTSSAGLRFAVGDEVPTDAACGQAPVQDVYTPAVSDVAAAQSGDGGVAVTAGVDLSSALSYFAADRTLAWTAALYGPYDSADAVPEAGEAGDPVVAAGGELSSITDLRAGISTTLGTGLSPGTYLAVVDVPHDEEVNPGLEQAATGSTTVEVVVPGMPSIGELTVTKNSSTNILRASAPFALSSPDTVDLDASPLVWDAVVYGPFTSPVNEDTEIDESTPQRRERFSSTSVPSTLTYTASVADRSLWPAGYYAVVLEVPQDAETNTALAAGTATAFGAEGSTVKMASTDNVTVVSTEHLDVFAAQIDATDRGPELRMRTKVGGSGSERWVDWDNLVVHVPDIAQTRVAIPASTATADYAFLGTTGQQVWQLDIGGTKGVMPWPGLSTEDSSLSQVDGNIWFRTDAVTGLTPASEPTTKPGEVVVWTNADAPTRTIRPFLTSYASFPQGQLKYRGAHAHYNWTFTAKGTYCIAETVLAQIDGEVQTSSEILTVVVGDSIDATEVEPCGRQMPDYPDAQTDPAPVAGADAYAGGAHGDAAVITGTPAAITPQIVDGRLQVGLRVESADLRGPGVMYDLDRTIVSTPGRANGPDAQYPNLAGAGDYIYGGGSFYAGNPGVSLGWDVSRIAPGAVRDDQLTWRLTSASGPGHVTIARSLIEGRLLSTTPGHLADTAALYPGTIDSSPALYFSSGGVYCLGFSFEATLRDGTRTSDQVMLTYSIDAGGVVTDPATITPGQCGSDDGPGSDPGDDPGTEPGDGAGTGPGDGSRGWADLPDSGREVLSVGHMDVLSTVGARSLRVQVHDDNYSPAKVHEVDDVTFFAAPESSVTDPGLSTVLGAGRTQAWVLPQVQDMSLLWPGWNVSPSGTRVTWTLDGVRGPGRFALFETAGFGEVSVLLSSSGRQKSFSYDEHAHGSWAFTEQGVYCLDSTFSSGEGAAKVSRSVTLLLAVGDVDPAKVTTAMCGQTPEQIVADDSLPTTAPAPVAESALTAGARGQVRVTNAAVSLSGGTVDVFVGTGQASRAVSLWWYSTPTHLGWVRVGADGWVRGVKVPSTTYGAHKLVVLDRDGALVGWAPVQVDLLAGGGSGGGGLGGSGGGQGNGGLGGSDGSGGGLPVGSGSTPPPTADAVCVATPVTRTVGASNVEVVSSGHFDFGSQLVGGRLVSGVKDDRNGIVWKDPDSLVFHVSDTAEHAVPGGYEFLGAAGTSVWSIPLTQRSGIPWLGWNTQHASLLSGLSGPVTFTLTSVDGPGQLAVYTLGTFGGVGQRVWDTVGGPRSTVVTLNQHVHANWSFTAPGVYHVTFTQSATTTGGLKVSSTGTLHFFVGSGDPRTAAPTTTVTDWVGRTASGQECDLSAEQLTAARGTSTPARVTSPAADLIARAAVQVEAPAAVLDETGDGIGSDEPKDTGPGLASGQDAPGQDGVAAAGRGPVPVMLGVLAALVLVGAAGTGTLWWRRAGAVRR